MQRRPGGGTESAVFAPPRAGRGVHWGIGSQFMEGLPVSLQVDSQLVACTVS